MTVPYSFASTPMAPTFNL